MNTHQLRVALVWNGTVFHEETRTQTSHPVVTVGEDIKNDFTIPSDVIPSVFEMFERTTDGYALRFKRGLHGELHLAGTEYDFESVVEHDETYQSDYGLQTDLAPGDWGVIDFGNLTLFFQVMAEGETVAGRGLAGRIDGGVVGMVAASAVMHLLVLLAAFFFFEVDPDLNDLNAYDRPYNFSMQDVPDPLDDKVVEDEPSEDTSSAKAKGDDGEFGDKKSEVVESQIPKQDGVRVDEVDVTKIGINEALSSELLGQGAVAQIFDANNGFADSLKVAMAGDGDVLVSGRGHGGMGVTGLDKGGGGDTYGRIKGMGGVDLGGRKPSAKLVEKAERKVKIKFTKQTPTVGNFCDSSNIRRVVNGKSNAIKYCFEKQLQMKPELAGKIIAQWKVGMDGKVMSSSIASSTMKDKKVEGCIARVIKRMRFEAQNGGICVINYPFVFSGL